MKQRICIWFLLVLTMIMTSCSGIRTTQLPTKVNESNCHNTTWEVQTPQSIPKPIHTLNIDTALTNRFSFQSLNTANAIGILELLSQFVELKKTAAAQPTMNKRIELVELSQKVNQRINIASLEISAIGSELDCEEERADQIANYLKSKEDNIETKLTVSAIIIGAASAVATGIILTLGNTGNTPEIIGISAGFTEATLGVLILANEKKTEFKHPRNALKDIWEAPEYSTIFPPSIWYYLTYENPENDETSRRQRLIDNWLSLGQIKDIKEKDKEKVYGLLYGEGGQYTADQLANRADMFDQIQAQITLMKQDLKLLTIEFEALNNGL